MLKDAFAPLSPVSSFLHSPRKTVHPTPHWEGMGLAGSFLPLVDEEEGCSSEGCRPGREASPQVPVSPLSFILGGDITGKCSVAPSSIVQPRGPTHTEQHPVVAQRMWVPLITLPVPRLPSPPQSLPSGSSTLLAAVVGGATGISVRFRMGGRESKVRRCPSGTSEKNEHSPDATPSLPARTPAFLPAPPGRGREPGRAPCLVPLCVLSLHLAGMSCSWLLRRGQQ